MQQDLDGAVLPSPSRRPGATRARTARRLLTSDRAIAVAMVAPSLIALAVFVYGFIGRTVYISLVRWNDLAPDYTFVGLANYVRLLEVERFQADLKNTLVFTVTFISLCLFVGLLLATLLDQRLRFEGLFRTIYMFPLAISFIVTGVAWRWLETPSSGINLLFDAAGLGFLKNGWFTDPNIGILGVVLAAFWQTSGYVMALYLAGLRGISDEVREAGRVDGANEWQLFWYIVFPLLHPITLTAVIILGHISLKIFDLTVSMTGPGPGFATDVPSLFMYQTTFFASRFSQGAAVATVLLLMVSLLIVPYLVYNARTEAQR
jgi:glucose/mannose transport system permease protein